MNGIGSGYLSGNMLVPFPFEDGQLLEWGAGPERSAELQQSLQACFVDACVYMDSCDISASLADGWPALGVFSASGDSLSFRMGAGGHEIALSVSASSEKFPIASGRAEWGSYLVVLSSEAIREFCAAVENVAFPRPAPDPSSSGRDGGSWLKLCPRCITWRPAGLSSIRVYDGVKPRQSGPHFVLSGDVEVRPGNNMLISEQDGANGFGINAVPGAGLGRIPCSCDDEGGGPGIGGQDGHARLFNDTCFDFEPDTSAGVLRIHGKCTACCTCDMYVAAVDRLAGLADIVRAARRSLSESLSAYEDAVARFNERMLAPRLADVQMSLSGMPIGENLSPRLDGSGVKGKMGRCAFTAVVRNSSYFLVTVLVASMSGTSKVVESSAAWSDATGTPQSDTVDGNFIGRSFSIYPGRSLVITFVSVKDEKVSSVTTGGFSGRISTRLSYVGPDGATHDLGSDSKSVEV